MSERRTCSVQGMPIDAISWDEAIGKISGWAHQRESRYVCIVNAHSVVTGRLEDDFGEVLRGADMCTPDGAPVAWMMRRLGWPQQQRINGPDLMALYCARAATRGEGIYLYGGTEQTLEILRDVLPKRFPGLQIAGSWSPPFRSLTAEEEVSAVNAINESGAGTIWVSLGCPKQERWMAAHRGQVRGVMIGVGAAFDYHAGTITRAPVWMRNIGMEWLHRLMSEPRRLWRRYLITNYMFIAGSLKQFLKRAMDGASRNIK